MHDRFFRLFLESYAKKARYTTPTHTNYTSVIIVKSIENLVKFVISYYLRICSQVNRKHKKGEMFESGPHLVH